MGSRYLFRTAVRTNRRFSRIYAGVWIAAGAGYFWPAWVPLGSAIAVAVKALPWPDMVRERYAA